MAGSGSSDMGEFFSFVIIMTVLEYDVYCTVPVLYNN